MKFTNIGGATGIVEQNGKRMLFDPWLDDGIFHGAWYHFPPSAVTIKDLGHLDYIYISHIHEDHCSAGTLKHLNRDAEIIVMDRHPNFVTDFLIANDFDFEKIHRIPPRTPTLIAEDLLIDMVEPDPSNEMSSIIDSSMVLRWGEKTLYNANDCQPYAAGIRYVTETYGQIDLALLPYTAGSGYPSCYLNLSTGEKIEERDRIAKMRVEAFADAAEGLNPKRVMPFADQYVVAGSRSNLNRFISHRADQSLVKEALRSRKIGIPVLLMNSGQTFDLESETLSPDEPFQIFDEGIRERYVAEHLRARSYDHEKVQFSRSVPIDRLVGYARERLWQAQSKRDSFPDWRFYVDIKDDRRRFCIDLAEPEVTELPWEADPEEPYLRLIGDHTLISMILIGHISWNIADAALFLDYERVPNRYDPELYVLLNYLRL